MQILEIHQRFTKIMKIKETHWRIMKIMKIIEIHTIITTVMKIKKKMRENYENHEKLKHNYETN